MVKRCPACGYEFDNTIKVCRNYIAQGKNKEWKRSSKKSIEEKMEMYNDMKETLTNHKNKNKKLTTNTFLKKYQLKGKTDGDLIRLRLDSFVCEGILTKIKFSCRKGHIYQINNWIRVCPFYKKGSLFSTCIADKQEFKSIGEYDGD